MLLVGCFTPARAQNKILVKAGLNVSDMTTIGEKFTGYEFGAGYRVVIPHGFIVQPELQYRQSGSRLGDEAWRVGCVEIPLNFQWGVDLVAFRPFVQVSPFAGCNVYNKVKSSDGDNSEESVVTAARQSILQQTSDSLRPFEYGISVGGGIDLLRVVQFAVNYGWVLSPVTDGELLTSGKPTFLQLSLSYIL